MHYAKMIKKSKKQQIIRSVAIVCAVCFFAVFMLSSVLTIDHNVGGSEVFSGCQRTLLPVCECDKAVVITIPQFHSFEIDHGFVHDDCVACVFLNKIDNQVRQINAALYSLVQIDINTLILAVLSISLLLFLSYTPIDLKSRINN